MREFWTSMASIMGVMAFCQGLLATIFPPELRFSLLKLLNRFTNYFSSYCYFDITEIDGVNTNELYNAVQLYLSSSTTSSSTRLSLTRSLNSSKVTFGLSQNDTLFDTFAGVTVQWEHIVVQRPPQSFSWRPVPEEKRGFSLRVRKAHSRAFLGPYLDHIMARAAEIRRRSQDRYLYTNSRAGGGLDASRPGHPWEAVPFKHPSTFDTLALDPARKAEIMADLRDFAEGEAFYRATGRAWKRGYLLHGPPGTGKSSMIAAMANHLGYDIYDLELTEVGSNSELRKLLMKTTPKSIIVIEDIDCSLALGARTTRGRRNGPPRPGVGPVDGDGPGSSVTLSGLLGFTDGLWSCCGSERIFVFTTNHVERLDPALLRSGRMDMHIHMSYCSFAALKILLKNYVGIENEDDLGEGMREEFKEVVDKARMTPADVSEVLIRRRREKMAAVAELLEVMKTRGERNCEEKLSSQEDQEEEEEEQEKRELEMHNGGGFDGGFDGGFGGGGGGEIGKNEKEEGNIGFDIAKECDDDSNKKYN